MRGTYCGTARGVRQAFGRRETPMCFEKDGRVIGIIAVADKVKPDANETIARLHALGKRVVMITGDNERVAKNIAAEVGIDEVRANTLRRQGANSRGTESGRQGRDDRRRINDARAHRGGSRNRDRCGYGRRNRIRRRRYKRQFARRRGYGGRTRRQSAS
ncbi:MAG: HAD family hydrolase [Christensenellales bacterium]